MARCPTCHRRVAPGASCARDGGKPAEAGVRQAPPAAPSDPNIRVKALLGAGGFGAVWDANISSPGVVFENVALKVSHSSDAVAFTRFRRESEILESVGPPHVPRFISRGRLADGRSYLAMERLVGRTLADELASFEDLPSFRRLAALGGALLESAAALHRHGVFHRDLKPENVFLAPGPAGEPVAKLVDFGLALSASTSNPRSTSTGAGAGTPEYMPPERITGKDGDLRSDVYALGVMLFEIVTLRLPFVGDPREVEYAHLSFRPPPPARFAAVPEPIGSLILRCLAKDPARRFVDASALRRAFTAALSDSGLAYVAASASESKRQIATAGRSQTVALVFVESPGLRALEIQTAVQPFGGLLAFVEAHRCVCAFTHNAGDHPGQRAVAAAEALVAEGLAGHLRVDVGTVTVKSRLSGPPRISSRSFSETSRFPRPEDAEGILITAAARETMPDLPCTPAPGRPDHFVLSPRAAQDSIKTAELSASHTTEVLFGREEDLRVLVAEAVRSVTDSRPRVASVVAEPGLGKSRLRLELARRLRAEVPNAEILTLSGREAGGQAVDEALTELLLRALGPPGQPPHHGGPDLLVERLGITTSEAAAAGLVLGWLTPDDRAVRAMRSAPGALRANAARAGLAALRRLTDAGPMMVLLDDAHWADDALLDTLEQATVSELPFWVCAFARPAFASSRPNWGLRASGGSLVRRLQRLDPASAGELCRYLLEPAAQVPQPVVERLVDRAEGVPLLIHDLIRGLRREGLVVQQSGGVWVVNSEVLDRLTDSAPTQWVARRELDAMPADLATHAQLVSLLPSEFTMDEVEGVLNNLGSGLLEAFPLDPRVGNQRLFQAGLLARRPNGRFTFRNELIRESVARMVDEKLATRVHEAALSFHRAGPKELTGNLSARAWHAAAAGHREEAAAAYLRLAEAARERHRYLEAELLYTRCLGQLDENDLRARLTALRGRGIMRYRLGRHDDSLTDLAQARAMAMKSADACTQADVLLDESMALDWRFDWPRSRELTEQARRLFPSGAPPTLESRILLALGRSLHRFNRDEEATGPLREAERIAQAIGDEGYEVRVIADLLLGLILPLIGRPEEAAERLERVQSVCQEKGDEWHLAVVRQNRSCLWITLNDRRRFEEDNARLLEYARRLGNANMERGANHNTAYFLYWRGEFEASLTFVRRMIEIDERCFRQGGFRPDGALLLARILWARGAEAAAARTLEEVTRHQAVARAEGQSALLLLPNDEMLLDMTTLLVEGGDAASWEALVGRARQVAQGQEIIEVLELAGVAAERRGDLAGTRRWWHEALEVGRRIPNVMGERIRQRLKALG
jgi:eukaryotic-like serine/threonine-protein kinase